MQSPIPCWLIARKRSGKNLGSERRQNVPKALDLFCKAGGASMGLHNAGFEVTGVDIEPQRNYPFHFVQADALTFPLEGFDFIWASPPCQAYSSMSPFSRRWGKTHPDLVGPVRERLKSTACRWVIENVRGAPLLNPIELCGLMFGLKTYRHRYFEANFAMLAPSHPKHDQKAIRERRIFTCVGHPGGRSARDNLHFGNTEDWRNALGIKWMKGTELSQAIPPAYSEYIARRFF